MSCELDRMYMASVSENLEACRLRGLPFESSGFMPASSFKSVPFSAPSKDSSLSGVRGGPLQGKREHRKCEMPCVCVCVEKYVSCSVLQIRDYHSGIQMLVPRT